MIQSIYRGGVKPQLGTEFNFSHHLARGVVSAVSFNENGGGGLNDCCLRQRHTFSATAPTWANGRFGPALVFNGSSSYTAVAHANASAVNFDRTNPFSVLARFKLSSLAADGIIVSKQLASGNFNGWYLGFEAASGGMLFSLRTTTTNRLFARGGQSVVAGRWYTACATYDGSSAFTGIKMYLDGIRGTESSIGDATVSGATTSTANYNIGTRGSEGTPVVFYNGSIGSVIVWNRVLTPNEVSGLCNTTNQLWAKRPSIVESALTSSRFSYSDMMTGGFV